VFIGRVGRGRIHGPHPFPAAPPKNTPLKKHVRENLANYTVPRAVVLLEELPRNAIGKIIRSELKARLPAEPRPGR